MCHFSSPGNGSLGTVMAVWEMSETELSPVRCDPKPRPGSDDRRCSRWAAGAGTSPGVSAAEDTDTLSGVDNRWVNYLGQAFITPHGEPIGQKGDPLADDVDPREELQRLTRDWGLRRAQLTGCALNVRLTGASHSWPHVHPRALHPPDSRFPGPGTCSSSPRRGSGRGRADRRGVRITYPV
jgi:hypothetical protein